MDWFTVAWTAVAAFALGRAWGLLRPKKPRTTFQLDRLLECEAELRKRDPDHDSPYWCRHVFNF